MILLIDNYDSFVFNLRRYFLQLGQTVCVLRNDAPELLSDLPMQYSAIVLSPGPKGPQDAGYCLEIVRQYSGRIPILGICLGHQIIFEAFGGRIGRSVRPTHGKSSPMKLTPSRLFAGISSETEFARYHSLVGVEETTPDWLRVIAKCPANEIMAVEHREHLTFGVQFHPESVLSLDGHRILSNFLNCVGLPVLPLPSLDLQNPSQAQAPSQPAEKFFEDPPFKQAVVLPRQP